MEENADALEDSETSEERVQLVCMTMQYVGYSNCILGESV
jgi:hypothetical protein